MKPKQQNSSSKESNKVEKLPLVLIPTKAVSEIVIPTVKTWSEHHSPHSKDSHSLDPSLNSFLNVSTVIPPNSKEAGIRIGSDGKVTISLPSNYMKLKDGKSLALQPYQHATVLPPPLSLDEIRAVRPIHRSSGEVSMNDEMYPYMQHSKNAYPLQLLSSSSKQYKVTKREDSLWGDENPEKTLIVIEEMKAQRQAFEQLSRLQKIAAMKEAVEKEELRRNRTISEDYSDSASGCTTPSRSSANTPSQRHRKRRHRKSKSRTSKRDPKKSDDDGSIASAGSLEREDTETPPPSDIPKFRQKEWRQQKIEDNAPLSPKEKEQITHEINQDIAELAHSEVRVKLKELASFIHRHTSRKLIQNWNMIEMRFKPFTNSQNKMLMIQPILVDGDTKVGINASMKLGAGPTMALSHPVKYPAMYPSQLISLLCSAQVKVISEEMIALLELYGVPVANIAIGRRIAALQLLYNVSMEEKSIFLAKKYKAEIEMLSLQESSDNLIANIEILQTALAKDLYERSLEIEFIKGNKQTEANKLLTEKRKKDEYLAKKAKQRAKIVEDYAKLFKGLIIFDGVMTKNKLTAFEYVIKHCERTINNYYMDQSARIPLDIASYIGLDAFPPYLEEKLQLRLKKLYTFKSVPDTSRATEISAMTSGKGSAGVSGTTSRVEMKPVPPAAGVGLRSDTTTGTATPATPAVGQELDDQLSVDTMEALRFAAAALISEEEKDGKIYHEGKYIQWEDYIVWNLINDQSKKSASVTKLKLLGTKLVPNTGEDEEEEERVAAAAAAAAEEAKKAAEEAAEKEAADRRKGFSLVKKDQKKDLKAEEEKAVVEVEEPVVTAPKPPKRMTIVYTLKEFVSFGKIFPGFSYRDTVEILQYVAATKIGAMVRMFNRHSRYCKARHKWTVIFTNLKLKYYTMWMRTVRYHVKLRRYCLRSIIAWKFFIKRKLERQHLFKQCFWPFYVWRKHAVASATAKEKTKFLVTRVIPTILKMTIFKAWKDYALWQQTCMKKAKKYYLKKILLKNLRQLFKYWRFKAYQRKKLRTAWFVSGVFKFRANIRSKMHVFFKIWKYYSYYRVYYERYHMKHYLPSYKQLLLYNYKKPFALRLSLTEKRLRISGKRKIPDPKTDNTSQQSRQSIQQLAAKKQTSIVGNIRRSSTVTQMEEHGSNDDDSSVGSLGSHSNKKAKKTPTKPPPEPGPIIQPQFVLKEIKRKMRNNRHFRWKFKTKHERHAYLEVDSDGEDVEDIPTLLLNCYHEIIHGGTDNGPTLYNTAINASGNRTRGNSISASTVSSASGSFSQGGSFSAGSAASNRKNSNVLSINRSIINRQNPLHQVTLQQIPVPLINPYYRLHSGDLFSDNDTNSPGRVAGDVTPPKMIAIEEEENDHDPPGIEAIFSMSFDNEKSGPATPRVDKVTKFNPPPPQTPPALPASAVYIPRFGMFDNEDYFQQKVSSLSKYYQYREIWNIFENSFRYYKFTFVAFQNLRTYAKIKRRVKLFKQKQRYELLQSMWLHWMSYVQYQASLIRQAQDNPSGNSVEQLQNGERQISSRHVALTLFHTLKMHHQRKAAKFKALNDQLKKIKQFEQEQGLVNSDHDDYYDEEKIARKKMRRLNQMDMAEKESSSSSGEDSDHEKSDLSDSEKVGLTEDEIAGKRMQKKYAKLKRKYQKQQQKAILKQAQKQAKNNRWAINRANSGADEEVFTTAQQRAVQRLAEDPYYQQLKDSVPNIFTWENEDRDIEVTVTKDMSIYSAQVKHIAGEVITKFDSDFASFKESRIHVLSTIQKIFSAESGKTVDAIKKQEEYAMQFKIHTVKFLVDVLYKVYREIQMNMIKEETKVYFRALRLPMLIKRSKAMLIRKKIVNWIRICNRLNAISRRAPFYYRMRIKWAMFNRWLKYLEQEKIHPTPALLPMIRRRLILHPDFHNALMKKGFDVLDESSYYGNSDLQHSVGDFKIIFSRWKMYAQENILFKLIHDIVTKLNRLKTLQKCYAILKNTGWNKSNWHHWKEEEKAHPTCFPIVRCETDLLLIVKRFIPLRRSQLPTRIRRVNQKTQNLIKKKGKNTLTFKKFMQSFQQTVMSRISTEQRLLFESFEGRGKQDYVDLKYPVDRDDPIVPPMMAKLEGKVFTDPHPPRHLMSSGRDTPSSAYLKESNIPAGFRLSKLKFAMQIHNTAGGGNNNSNAAKDPNAIANVASVLLGWQLVWTAEGCREIESSARGSWNAAGITIQEIIIPKDDFITGVEYLYDGPTIVAIRLKLMTGGYTRWVGGRASLSTLGVAIDVTMAPKEDFELDRKLQDDEIASPAVPFSYVIGFSGVIHNRRPTCLGLIVRKVRYQHVFSFNWVSDVIVQKKINLDQTSVAIKDGGQSVQGLVSVDGVDTIPSGVGVPVGLDGKPITGGDPTLQQDSLTLSQGDASFGMQNPMDGGGGHAMKDDAEESSEVTEEQEGEEGDDEGDGEEEEDNFFSEEEDEEEEDGGEDGDGHGDGATDGQTADTSTLHTAVDGEGKPVGGNGKEKSRNNNNRVLKTRRMQRGLKRFNAWKKGEDMEEPLTSSETQFFDVLRMRLTELMGAKQRAEEFAKRLWTSKDLRAHPMVSKLLNLRSIASLTMWYFNALSRHLIKDCPTEYKGMLLIKQSKQWANRVKSLLKKSRDAFIEAFQMERTPQPWTGKHMLSPTERQLKKDYQNQILALREQGKQLEIDAEELKRKSQETERIGRLLLPRISLSTPVFTNFKTKLSAARHKENLLETMTLDEIKNGLFGSNMKEVLLNKDQMEAIHASLKDKKFIMKDKTSLQRLVDDILVNEFDIQQEDVLQDELRNPFGLTKQHSQRKGRHLSLGSAPSSTHGTVGTHTIPTTSISSYNSGLTQKTSLSSSTATYMKFLKKPNPSRVLSQSMYTNSTPGIASMMDDEDSDLVSPQKSRQSMSSFPSATSDNTGLQTPTIQKSIRSGSQGSHVSNKHPNMLATVPTPTTETSPASMSRVKAQVHTAVAMSKSLTALPASTGKDAKKEDTVKHMSMTKKASNKRPKQ